MTLKLAIYFIAPVVVLYIAAFLCAGLFTPIAQMFVERDISHDTAMNTSDWQMPSAMITGPSRQFYYKWLPPTKPRTYMDALFFLDDR